MTKQVFLLERSPLSKNVYSILLSKIYNIDITLGKILEPSESILYHKDKDLFIIDEMSINHKKNDILKIIKENPKMMCIFITHKDKRDGWKEFPDLKNIKLLERPFFPDDFLKLVKDFLE